MNKKLIGAVIASFVLVSCGTAVQENPEVTEVPEVSSEETSSVIPESSETTENTSVSDTASTEISSEIVTTAETSAEQITEVSELNGLSEGELKNFAEENIQGYLNCFVYDDFDCDGLSEAFAIAGDTANGGDDWWDDGICSRVYFVNNTGNVSLIKDKLLGDYFWTDREKIVQFGNKKFFTFSATAGGSGVEAYIFGVQGDMCTEPDISASEGKIYSSFYTGKDGKVYAEDDSFFLSGGGRQFFEHLIEYDEEKDEFTVVENNGLAEAEKYADTVIKNEDIWLPDLSSDMYAQDAYFCGFADLNNDNIPEFIVSEGHHGAHGAEGYCIYRFENDTMVRFRSDPSDPPDSVTALYFMREDPVYLYDSDIIDYCTVYPFPMYFIQDKETGKVRYISAYYDAPASGTYCILTEYTFEDGLIKHEDIAEMIVDHNHDGTASYNFYKGNESSEEITAEEFLEIYDSLFDREKNNINNDAKLWTFIGEKTLGGDAPMWESEYSYLDSDKDLIKHILVSDYVSNLNVDQETWIHNYDTVYSSAFDSEETELPFAALIEDLRK